MEFVIRMYCGPDENMREQMHQRGKKRKNDDDDGPSQSKSCYDWHHWEQKERSLLALKKGILSDITFEVGPDAVPFKSHKLILALASPVFEAMFYGDLAEKGEKIAVTDIMPDGFEHMLEFIYSDDTIFLSETGAFQAWIAADKYCMNTLKKKCDDYFSTCTLQPNNIWLLLENSIFISCISLTNKCLNYLRTHIQNSLHIQGFLETTSETLQRLLHLDPMDISELGLLRAVLRWGKHKIENEEAESLSEVLAPLLKYIRFGALTSSEFSTFLSEYENAISPQDAVAIFMHLSNPACFKLPDMCSPKTFQRSYTIHRDDEGFPFPPRAAEHRREEDFFHMDRESTPRFRAPSEYSESYDVDFSSPSSPSSLSSSSSSEESDSSSDSNFV